MNLNRVQRIILVVVIVLFVARLNDYWTDRTKSKFHTDGKKAELMQNIMFDYLSMGIITSLLIFLAKSNQKKQ